MIAITAHSQGLILPGRAQPGARKTGVLGEQGSALKVAVAAPPEDGRANQALVEALRKLLGVNRSQIALVSGATSRNKKFLISGLEKEEVERRVAGLLMNSP
ncbi:MAG: DUF167 domain-containing protein [Gemmataceae bacterium]